MVATTRPATAPGTGGTPASTLDPRAVTALSALVAVEHAAVYGTASAGGALAPLGVHARDARGLAAAAYTAHRQLRDALIALLLGAGAKPPAAQPAYTLPVNPASVTAALTLLAELDDRTGASAYDAVGSVTGAARELVVDALAQAALRAQRARLTGGAALQAAVIAFPGRL